MTTDVSDFTTIEQVLQRQREIVREMEMAVLLSEGTTSSIKNDFSVCWIDLRRAIDQDDAKKISETMKAMLELIEKRL